MKKFGLICIALLCVSFLTFGQARKSNLSFVDPTIGGVGRVLTPTRPAAHLPNSMVKVFPMRHDALDDQIWYFPLTVASYRLDYVFALMPVDGPIDKSIWSHRSEYTDETTTPYYYSVSLAKSGIEIEFSPQARSGYFKFKFSGHQDHYLRLAVIHNKGKIDVQGKRVITGIEDFSGMKAYFYAKVNTDISGVKYENSGDENIL